MNLKTKYVSLQSDAHLTYMNLYSLWMTIMNINITMAMYVMINFSKLILRLTCTEKSLLLGSSSTSWYTFISIIYPRIYGYLIFCLPFITSNTHFCRIIRIKWWICRNRILHVHIFHVYNLDIRCNSTRSNCLVNTRRVQFRENYFLFYRGHCSWYCYFV